MTQIVGFEHRTAKVNDVSLHYVICGTGEPVVLLHGWPTTWYAWHRVMPILAEKYTVIAPDLRGMGDSEKPGSGYDKKNVAEDIYQLVKHLGFNQINLVGYDIGGMVAYAYAVEHPENVRRLVLMEFLIPGFGLEEFMDVAKGGSWHFGFHAALNFAEMLVTGKERQYITEFMRQVQGTQDLSLMQQYIDEYVRTYSAPSGLRGGFEHYRTLVEDGQHNQLSMQQKGKLKMPVLVFGGQRSIQDRLLKAAPQVAENVRGGVIENCGHHIPSERPDYLAQQLLIFFGEEINEGVGSRE